VPKDVKVTTWIVPNQKRKNAYKWLEREIEKNKTQAFIICPLIEESFSETMSDIRSVKKEFQNIKKIFPNLEVGLLHGKQSSSEKNSVINYFKNGDINILVSTPVVEVGIDIQNAAFIIIEAADRFGLINFINSGGRVGRGAKKSYCLLFTDSASEKTLTRLNALTKTHSGFELSELDLKLRGPGEIFGLKQSGIPELKIASWQDIDLIKSSRLAALEIYKKENQD
jgi:ATP-dependent DNA helicase RecG